MPRRRRWGACGRSSPHIHGARARPGARAREPFPSFDEERRGLALELRPRVVSFHFGVPSAAAIRRITEAGCVILSSATTVAEARSLEANGADLIIAQGFEAGGHRGSFSDSPGAGMVGTMAPVPQIADAVRTPVIAAGGIANARGIAAAFALGRAACSSARRFCVVRRPQCRRLTGRASM